MRHQKAVRLAGNSGLNKATIRDVAKATLLHQRIKTTKLKAKEARKLVDRLITLGKKDTLAARRKAFAILCDHRLVSRLFSTIAVRFQNRQGGYTRIIPLSRRRGDQAQLVLLELTEKEEISTEKKAAKSKKKTKEASEAALAPEPESQPEKPKKNTKEAAPAKKSAEKAASKKSFAKEEKASEKENEDKKKMFSGLKKIFKKDKDDKKK